ncbi:MAG: glycosyltransferase family 4 protein [Chloroflexi bacterium]|nr:glycosyltransferase family 4 protein [Chloroflexota bacterium]
MPETPDGRPPRSVVVLVNNPFVTDARSWKMASTLAADGYGVTVVARAEAGLPSRVTGEAFDIVRLRQPTPFARLPSPRLPLGEEAVHAADHADRSSSRAVVAARGRAAVAATLGRAVQAARYLVLTRRWARDIARVVPPTDVWQAEQMVTLPLALELRRRLGGLVVYDSHDLDVQSARFARLPGPWRRLLARSERRWARSADGLISANSGYAKVLEREWGRAPTVIWNGPPPFDPGERPERRWHRRLGLDADAKVVLFLGLVMPGRGIAELCRAMAWVPGAVLAVAGYGSDYERYREAAAALPHADRIYFPGSVPHREILPLVAAADVSAMPVQGDTLNHRLNVPTKLFDAMAAGVPVVASDLPGMAPIVRATGCGQLCDPDDPADIARAIRSILEATPERRAEYRKACLAAARGPYGWEAQAATLRGLYARLRLRD